MDLLGIRTKFVELSGRYDLVVDTDDYADNGADWFITAGQRVLDNLVNFSENTMIVEDTTVDGTELFTIQNIRTVEKVWVLDDDDETEIFLNEMFLEDFKQKYAESTDEGLPKEYALVPLREASASAATLQYKGILLGPTPDSGYTIKVLGRFFSHTLSSDSDENFWTLSYPHTLVQAAMYCLERFHRNRQGMADHMAAIEFDVQGIDFDEVEQQIASRSSMADSFNERKGRHLRQINL